MSDRELRILHQLAKAGDREAFALLFRAMARGEGEFAARVRLSGKFDPEPEVVRVGLRTWRMCEGPLTGTTFVEVPVGHHIHRPFLISENAVVDGPADGFFSWAEARKFCVDAGLILPSFGMLTRACEAFPLLRKTTWWPFVWCHDVWRGSASCAASTGFDAVGGGGVYESRTWVFGSLIDLAWVDFFDGDPPSRSPASVEETTDGRLVGFGINAPSTASTDPPTPIADVMPDPGDVLGPSLAPRDREQLRTAFDGRSGQPFPETCQSAVSRAGEIGAAYLHPAWG